MKMTILKINDDEDTMDQVVKNEICWYEGLYQGWQWQEDGKIQNDKDEKEDDASYPLTSSGNPVYIPSVAKTNNFSKLSVCCRNKNRPTEPNQETKLKSQQKHRKRINWEMEFQMNPLKDDICFQESFTKGWLW